MPIKKTYFPKAFEESSYGKTMHCFGPWGEGKPFSVMMPPPNITGTLHLGHALNCTLQDILVRWHRLKGERVLWQPGSDHAGIATQVLVEKQLAQKGESAIALGRREFVKRVWQWKEHSGGAIGAQLRRLGVSADWTRERFTLDEGLCRAVNRAFCRLHEEGLVYRGKYLVNWDVKLGTAISDLEVENRPQRGSLWHIRYEVAGGGEVVVATTRPETIAGDVAVAVHPKDDRYKGLVGKTCTVPLFGRKIPIIADEYANPEKGSGAVKITPAHDFNDFEVGVRHELPLLSIFDERGCYNQRLPQKWRGMSREKARKEVLRQLGARLLKEEKIELAVPYGDRSGSVIEPYLSDQWFVNSAKLAPKAIEAVKKGEIRFFPKNWENTYFEWLRNIKPWCISRRLWWGHRIPAWYGEDGGVFVADDESKALAQAKKHYGREVKLSRDQDVLDTWFSSALWPFSTLGWPEESDAYREFYPTSVLVTGFDIIFFWVARMVMMGIYFTGDVPFRKVYVHALVRDEKGQKMSKSRGNVIDPLELINRYGADSLRLTLAALSTPGRDVRLSEKRVQGYRNFVTKLWNAGRFLQLQGCEWRKNFRPQDVADPINRWIISTTIAAAAELDANLRDGRFDRAALGVYHFVWDYFCDWYLEFAKQLLGEKREETAATVAWCFRLILQLAQPFIPLAAEKMWENSKFDGLLAMSRLPSFNEAPPAAGGGVEEAISCIKAIRTLKSELGISGKPQLVVVGDEPSFIVKHKESIKRLARLERVTNGAKPPPRAISLVGFGDKLQLVIGADAALAEEKVRLDRRLQERKQQLRRLEHRLNNPQFQSNAAAEVVAKSREQKIELLAIISDMERTLDRLRGLC